MADTTLSIQIQVQTGELKRLRKEHDSLVRKIQGDWKTTSRRVKNDSDRMFKGLRTGFKAVGTAMVAMKLVDFGRSIVQVGVRMEGLRNGLVAVEGSTKAAAKAMKELQEISLLPGISLSQAIEARINLRAVKLNADLANRSIKAMGNSLAIVGKSDELSGVVLGMTQMVSAGKVLQEEINQISSRIPQFRQAMKDAFGTAQSKDIQKMGISVEDFLSRTVAQLEKLPKATGGAANAISNLGNAFTKFGDNLFQKFLPQFQSTVESMARVVEKAADIIAPPELPALAKRFREGGAGERVVRPFGGPFVFREKLAGEANFNRQVLSGATIETRALRTQLGIEFRAARAAGDEARMASLIEQGKELARVTAQQTENLRIDRAETTGRLPGGGRVKPIRGGVGLRTQRGRPLIGGTGINLQVPQRGVVPGDLPGITGVSADLRRSQETTTILTAGGRVVRIPQRGLVAQEQAGLLPIDAPLLSNLFEPDLRPRAGQTPIRAPERLPIGARDFQPFGKKFETGMKDITMSSLRATATITNAFANMAASMENSTLRVIASVLDMITSILAAVGQGGKSGIGGALTSLGVGVGLATGVGIGFAVVGGGLIIADTIASNRNSSQSTRTQTRFLRTN